MSGTSLTLRPLIPPDLDAVVAIDRVLSGHRRDDFFARRLNHAIAAPAAFAAIAAERGGELVGYGLARIHEDEFGTETREAALDAIGVTGPPGQGVGRELLAALADRLRGRGVRALTTEVAWTDRPLLGFFARTGFALAPRLVLVRATAPDADAPAEPDPMTVRSMTQRDCEAVGAIDRRITGRNRAGYLAHKLDEAMRASAIGVSLVAERAGSPAGFLMARVDFGEFGHTESEAVLDTIGVDPRLSHQGVATALLSQLLMNLGALRVETLRTEVAWNRFGLLAFLDRRGFGPHRRLALRLALMDAAEPATPLIPPS